MHAPMDNIFSYAPKELTNSAMWAWIISSLKTGHADDPRYVIAKNIFTELGIPIPAAADVAEVQTERSFKLINTGPVTIPSGQGRIDVFVRISGARPAVLFIENKVTDLSREVAGLLTQIQKYDEQFRLTVQRLPTYATTIYPAYFGYEDWVADELVQYAHQSDPSLASRLRVFPVTKMIAAFQGTGFESDPVLSQFYAWLLVKQKFIDIRRKARLKQHAPISDVIEAGRSVGFGHLLEKFMSVFDNSLVRSEFTDVRVDIRNINFRRYGSTPITIRWFYNSGPNGLYVGLHEDLRQTGRHSFFRRLPGDFAYEQDQRWVFGYLRTEADVERFFEP